MIFSSERASIIAVTRHVRERQTIHKALDLRNSVKIDEKISGGPARQYTG